MSKHSERIRGLSVNDPSTATAPYPLDNRNRHSASHHAALADLLDPDTRDTVASLAPGGDWTGATCLEVGAGGGSVALWLADAVGDTGRVVATDREPDQIPDHPRLTVVRHDLCTGAPLPPGPYHLVHARLVLTHLPEREAILDRLVGLLAPGGAILVEDWAPLRARDDVVVAAPDRAAADLYGRYQRAVGERVFDAYGSDPGWARRIHRALLSRGLTGVETRVRARYWSGGGAGCRLTSAVLAQLRPHLLRAGMTVSELDGVLMLLSDPRLVLHGHPMYSTSGYRPTA